MPPVTCYICGRDFGSKSVGIHLTSCKKKWEAEQEKLPKKERRPIPAAPQDFDKVLKGEIKGKDLAKINQKASEEHNDSALETCQFCARTFKPEALVSHHRACTQDKPMVKNKGPGHASQLKAKVSYPKVKSKGANLNKEKKTTKKIKEQPKVKEEEVKKESIDTFNLVEKTPTSVKAKPPLLAGGSSKIHGVFAYFQKDPKEINQTDSYNEEDGKDEDTNINESPYVPESSSTNTSKQNSPVVMKKLENESLSSLRSGSEEPQNEEEWILVNPQASREFINDIKQKILQCVSSTPSEESLDNEEMVEEEPQENLSDECGQLENDDNEEQNTDEHHIIVDEKERNGENLEMMDSKCSSTSNPKESLIEVSLYEGDMDVPAKSMTYEERLENENLDNIFENNRYIQKENEPEAEKNKEGSPERKDIIEYIREEPLYDDDEHRYNLMELITNYAKDIKRKKILEILDNSTFDDEDSVEDAVFLMSEILYSK